MAFLHVFFLSLQVLFWVNSVLTEDNLCMPTSSSDKYSTSLGQRRVVCYFINWATDRYQPSNVDVNLCTHILYAFAILDNNTLAIESSNPTVDITKRLYEQVVALRQKNPKLRILLALGGWADSEFSGKYSRMISSEETRKNFIDTSIRFLETYDFDGLDLDWEFPVCWWQNCSKGPAADKKNFAKLTKEMRQAFDRHNPPLLLTAAISAVKEVIDESYDIEQLSKWLHFINVMAYDYHSDTAHTRTVHHSAMYNPKGNVKDFLNVNFTMNYLLGKGASRDKLVLGIPAYGRSYYLRNEKDHGIGSPTANGTVGYVAYNKLCQEIKSKVYTVVRDPAAGPYAYNGAVWVGYDDPVSAFEKGKYVKSNNFGGVMMWEVTMDDYKKRCCEVEYPLLKAMIRGMSDSDDNMACRPCVYSIMQFLPIIVLGLLHYSGIYSIE